MDISILLGKQIIVLFLLGIVGFILVRAKILKAEDATVFSKLAVYVLMPCVVIRSFQIEYTAGKMTGLLFAFIVSAVIHVIFMILCKFIKKIFHPDAVEETSIIYSNCANIMVPLVANVLGEEWIFYTSAYIVTWTILFWLHGRALLDKRENASPDGIKVIFSNPNIIAIILGLILFISGAKLPFVISETVSQLSTVVGPVSMLVVGMLLGSVDLKESLFNKRLYIVCFIRLILFPVLIILIMKIVGIANILPDAKALLFVVVFQMSAPVATIVTQMAQVCGQDSKYASVINVVSVFFCILTMPAIVLLYELLIH